jgi:hypothetical protein
MNRVIDYINYSAGNGGNGDDSNVGDYRNMDYDDDDNNSNEDNESFGGGILIIIN